MSEEWILASGFLGASLGGALGAKLSHVAAWKGAAVVLLASIVQLLVGEAADIDNPFLNSLVYVGAVALIGGPVGLKMTSRPLSLVIIGSFLGSILLGAVAIFLTVSPASD